MGNDGIIAVARRALEQYRVQEEKVDQQTVVFPPQAVSELHRALAFATREAAFQVLPFREMAWTPTAFEDAVWRDRAQSGVKVLRVYILPHKGIENGVFKRQLALDRDAGIDSQPLILSSVPQEDSLTTISGLMILDGSTAVIARGGSLADDTRYSWTVTTKPEDLSHTQTTWRHVRDLVASRPGSETGKPDLEEPLALSADIIFEVAGVLCTYDQADRERKTCSWYHSVWQYLRLMDLVSTPTWHSRFYHEELVKALSRGTEARSAITGCADYSMLAFLKAASDSNGFPGSFSVIDRCPTPLFACKWYARHLGFEVTTFEEDLFDPKSRIEPGFDLICTDALLTRFSRAETRDVLRRWKSLIRPGGRVVTTVRVHPLSPAARSPEEAVQDFSRRAVQRYARWRSFLRRTPAEIGELAETYARRMQSENLGDVEEIMSMFRESGFVIERHEVASTPGELQRTTYLELSLRGEEFP